MLWRVIVDDHSAIALHRSLRPCARKLDQGLFVFFGFGLIGPTHGAGRAANSSGCVARPKERAIGLIGFAEQIQRSSLIGSCAMEAAEHREPCKSRGSCTDLGAPRG